MSDVTQILQQIEQGDPAAAERLLPLVYEELKPLPAAKVASEQPDHTQQRTVLVHEAYRRLVDAQQWQLAPRLFLSGGRVTGPRHGGTPPRTRGSGH